MNGPHDLGGQMGFGPIAPEANEPVFHAEWEKRVVGMVLCAGAFGYWNIDISRHARENRHPSDYYGSSYYEIWFKGLERLLTDRGFLGDAPPVPKRVLHAEDIPAVLARGGPCDRPTDTAPRYAVGESVRTRNMSPTGHTRLPRYARGKRGTITAVNESYVFADTNAHAQGENPQWLYTVAFTGDELWGDGADPTLTVSIDAFEPYLDRA